MGRPTLRIIAFAVLPLDGDCIDVLTAFNGASGKNNAYKSGLMNLSDCCYPSAKGQQLMAELLIKTGTTPVVLG